MKTTMQTGEGPVPAHEPDQVYPERIEVRMVWSKGKSTVIEIGADEFFGRGIYGAPLSGDGPIEKIEQQRRRAP